MKNRTKEVLDNAVERMFGKIDHAIASAAMNIEDAEDNYLLPKALAKALLRDAVDSIGEPIGAGKREFQHEVDNLYAII